MLLLLLLYCALFAYETAYQEDKVLVCRDLNALIPAASDVDRSIRRSLFAIFDGRKYHIDNAVIT
jgi:hypothetical protein